MWSIKNISFSLVICMSYLGIHGQQKFEALPFNGKVNFTMKNGHHILGYVSKSTNMTRRFAPGIWYYSYVKDTIFCTQGGTAGKLLDGRYQELFSNRTIHTSGSFDNGKKVGNWKVWNTNGYLIKESMWENGRETGAFRFYNDSGIVTKSGRFKNGELHGKIKDFNLNGEMHITRYKNGKTIVNKSWIKREFGKIPFFRSKK